MLNFENLDKANFLGIGKYDAPIIQPEHIDVRHLEWIPFNFAKTCTDCATKGIHFFVDDYQFQRVWNQPDKYIPMLRKFGAVCAPDFSMYTDMPLAMQIYNHYRKHWLAAYWQQCGIHVVPTLCWSNEQSYEWCFDGDPQHSIVAISSVGTQQSKQNQALFEKGVRAALARLEPSEILWYGKCPEEFDWNVTRIQPYYKRVKRRCENGR
jgi:hypothetical protein